MNRIVLAPAVVALTLFTTNANANIDQLKGNLNSLKKNISADVIKNIESIQVKESELLNPVNWKT